MIGDARRAVTNTLRTLMLVGVITACASGEIGFATGSTQVDEADDSVAAASAPQAEAVGTIAVADPTETSDAPRSVTVNGGAIYSAVCSSCHGVDGSGGSASNIQSAEASTVIDAMLVGRTGMPSFSAQLTPTEIEAVAFFVTTGF